MKKSLRQILTGVLCLAPLVLTMPLSSCSGCRDVAINASPDPPKQGDMLDLEITADDGPQVMRVDYTVNGVPGVVTSIPSTVPYDTCKTTTGQYMTELALTAEVLWTDNDTDTFVRTHDLTWGRHSREDSDLNHAAYIGTGSTREEETTMYMAGKFKGAFDTFTRDQYYWAEPYMYTTNALQFVNGTDLALSFGHGSPQQYRCSSGNWVSTTETEYGNMAQCYGTGDLEYLIFSCCNLLSVDDVGTTPFWDYWYHRAGTEMNKRPFTGLHQAMGFRTHFSIHAYHWGYWRTYDGKSFMKGFANRLDGGWAPWDAWVDAAADKLSHSGNKNMAAVTFLELYESDTVTSTRDDYIYGNILYEDPTDHRKVAVWLE